jgi:hypothetical protein
VYSTRRGLEIPARRLLPERNLCQHRRLLVAEVQLLQGQVGSNSSP